MVLMLLGSALASSSPACSPSSRTKCSSIGQKIFRCSLNEKTPVNKHGVVSKQLISCLASSLLFISPPSLAIPAETFAQPGWCQIAAVAIIDNASVPLKFDSRSDDGSAGMMMRGITAKNFDPVHYSGRWFEVASFKGGLAGQGQEDCRHSTQGVYSFDEIHFASMVDLMDTSPEFEGGCNVCLKRTWQMLRQNLKDRK